MGGSRGGGDCPLKLAKVSLFTVILYNSEISIRDLKPFCHLLFCHSRLLFCHNDVKL